MLLMERPVDTIILIPCRCNCSMAFWVEVGTWWVLKLMRVPSISKKTALNLKYLKRQRYEFLKLNYLSRRIITPPFFIKIEKPFTIKKLINFLLFQIVKWLLG